MSEVVVWILGAIVVFLGGAWAAEKGKTDKARKARDEAQERVIKAAGVADVEKIEKQHTEARARSGSDWFNNWRKPKSDGKY